MSTLTLSRQFNLRLTIGRAIELKRLELLDVFDLPRLSEQVADIIGDPVRISGILFEMADKEGWQFESFLELLASATPEEKWEALKTTVDDFFPVHLKPWINGLFDAVRDAHVVMANKMLASLTENETSDEPDDTGVIGMDSGISPASWESILVPSPTESSTSWPSAASEPSGVEQAT